MARACRGPRGAPSRGIPDRAHATRVLATGLGLVPRARTLARANYNVVVRSATVVLTRGVVRKRAESCRDAYVSCGKDATKWLVSDRLSSKLVDKYLNPGHKHLISPCDLGERRNLWQSVSRSSRSTCQRFFEPQGEREAGGKGASQEERIPSSGQWSSVHCSKQANDVKCLPSKMFCPTRNIVGVPRKPRGAGEFRLTSHSGFSAV